MKTGILLLLACLPLLGNHSQQVSVLLDAGIQTVTVHNFGTGGSDTVVALGATGATNRWRFTVTTIYKPPLTGDTYTPSSGAVTVNINRNWGQVYWFQQEVDGSGVAIAGKVISSAGGAYVTNACGGKDTLPQVEFSTITTAPLPMPIEALGQDCYVTRVQVPLVSGHASSSLRLYFRISNPAYTNAIRPDGKISFQVNSGSWLTVNNASVTCIDEAGYYGGIGGYPRVRECTLPIPDGTISSGHTTATIGIRFNGTEGNTSGARILVLNIVEANFSCTQAVVTLSPSTPLATFTCAGSNYGFGDTVIVQNAPGMYKRFNGTQQVSGGTTNAFAYTPCTETGCVPANGTYTVPVNRSSLTTGIMTQPVMYVARGIIAATAFTQTDPTTWVAPPSGDAARGENLWKFGNTAGTVGTDRLVNPNFPYVNNALHYATCGGARGCHFTQGTDLKIFNYSNHAIQRRSEFHGLSEQDGLDIAAYIRGLSVPVPPKGRPWNPPFQPGPGVSVGTFWKSTGTLTQIATNGSGLATATFNADPGFVAGDPIIVADVSADTDLNGQYTIIGGSGTTRTFQTTNVTANTTFTDAAMFISAPLKQFAGCGIDCVLTYGSDQWEYLATPYANGDFAWNKRLEVRDIPIHWQAADWNQYLAIAHPADAFPALDFLSSTGFTTTQGIITGMTPNNFTSFASNGYGAYGSAFTAFINQVGTDTQNSAAIPPPGLWPQIQRFSVQQYMLTKAMEIAFEDQSFHFYGRYLKAAFNLGPTPTSSGFPIANGSVNIKELFQTGIHKISLNNGMYNINWAAGTPTAGCTYQYQSNIWYVMTAIFNAANGLDTPDNPLDNGYYAAFLRSISEACRPTGYMTNLYAQITSDQAGNLKTNMHLYPTTGDAGTDWGAITSPAFSYPMRVPYWFLTASDYTNNVINPFLDMVIALFVNTHDATYWSTVFTNAGATCSASASAAWAGNGNDCGYFQMILAVANAAGGDQTKIGTIKTWLETLSVFTGHDFDIDVAAGVQGDTANGATCSDCGTPSGSHTINLSSCPITTGSELGQWVISGTGVGDIAEPAFRHGGSCTQGMAGTVVFDTLTLPHTGTITVTYGCSRTVQPVPNYGFGLGGINTWRCSDMF